MKRYLKKVLKIIGIKKVILNYKSIIRFIHFIMDYRVFKKMYDNSEENMKFEFMDLFPKIHDKTISTPFDRYYILHTAWAARKLRELNPKEHYDISSSLFFVSNVSAFVKIKFFDYHPADLNLSNLITANVDLVKLPFEDNSINSLSCMHVVEHIGLGRYGDPLDVSGDRKAIEELKRVISPSGDLIFVVPIGQSKVMFNAHKVYSYQNVIDIFNDFELIEFSLIPDSGKGDQIVYNASKEDSDR